MWLKGKPDTKSDFTKYLVFYDNKYYICNFHMGDGMWHKVEDGSVLAECNDSIPYEPINHPLVQDKLWIARDKCGTLFFYSEKPKLKGDYFEAVDSTDDYSSTELPEEMYPAVTFENSPLILSEIKEPTYENL